MKGEAMLKDILVPIVIFGSMIYGIKIWLDYRIRRLLIEKGQVDEKVKFLYEKSANTPVPGSLKWGMVLVAIGLAIFLAPMLGTDHEEYTIGLMALFGGVALVGYHILALRMTKNVN
jgi:hypothetical protein